MVFLITSYFKINVGSVNNTYSKLIKINIEVTTMNENCFEVIYSLYSTPMSVTAQSFFSAPVESGLLS